MTKFMRLFAKWHIWLAWLTGIPTPSDCIM